MFDLTKLKVRRKARQHKFWLEKVSIYPYPYEVNGVQYFLVDYLKMRHPTGTAVFSNQDEVIQDAKRAHQRLYHIYRLMEKIQEESRMRAGVDLDFFRTPLKLMDKYPDEGLKDGYELIELLLSAQLTYRKTYEQFWVQMKQKKEKRQPLTEADWELTIETAAKLETLQNQMTKDIFDHIGRIRQWKEAMKEKGLWEKMTSAVQVFYLQLLENEDLMKEQVEKLKNYSYERALNENRTQMKIYMKKEQIEDEKVLRYPQ